MMLPDGMVRNRWSDEVTGDQFGALMNQLVERMLPVGSRFTSNDRSGLIRHALAVTINVFPVAFHIALLKISGKPMQVLIVWQNGMAFCVKEIVVPYTK